MPTPQEIRRIRLANDYKQMCNIQGSIISWVPTKGTAPYIEEYKITINVRTIIGVGSSTPKYRDSSVVILTLPSNYPMSKPKVVMESLPQPFHPNWFTSKNWCSGEWVKSEALGDHVIRMVKTLQFDPDITNEYSPANTEANSWYKDKKHSGLFPCDRTKLPDPSTPNSGSMSRNSGFVIKRRG
jgi:Ubiquitin-protein ligase